MKYRSECKCSCHDPNKFGVMHVVACCEPDPQRCDKTKNSKDSPVQHVYAYDGEEYQGYEKAFEIYRCVNCGRHLRIPVPE